MSNNERDFDQTCRFLIKLGEAAHSYGSNAARLEDFMSRLITALGFQGVFRSTPTEIVFAFEESEGAWQRTHVSAMPGSGIEMNRLARVGELVDAVVAGRVSVEAASTRLDEIDRIPPPWGDLANAISYVFVGAGFSMLMSGSWWDVLFASLFSLVVFGATFAAGHRGGEAAAWLPVSTAFIAGLLTAGAKLAVPELNLVLVTLSSIVILVPGYPVSVGVIELVSGHVVAGTANLVNGLFYLVKQFAGAWLGVGLVMLFQALPHAAPGAPVDSAWLGLAIPMLIIALCVAFQTAARDFVWAGIVCAAAYGGIVLGSDLVGANLGNLIGTAIAVMLANLWARTSGRPTSIVLLPAIVLLVSGSIGLRGLAAIAQGDVDVGEQQFAQMFVVALTIAGGLLVGNTIVRPRATL